MELLRFVGFLLLGSIAYATTVNHTIAAIQALEKAFANDPDILVFPGTMAYTTEIEGYWNIANQEIKPQLVVSPRTSTQAATALKIIANNQANFAIRSGGHMPNKGFNTSPDITIVTTALNSDITYPAAGIVRVGPGITWGTVYSELLSQNGTAVGGRAEQVGVAGFLLGGGLSHLSMEHGYGADNVVNMEVVLANGEIVDANETCNSDLFWALKGGANNFGLVTQFDLKIIPQDGVWGGALSFAPEHLDDVLEALQDWQVNRQPNDLKAAIEVELLRGTIVNSTATTAISIFMYYGAPVPFPETFSRFTAIPSVSSTLRVTTLLSLTQELAAGSTNTMRQAFYAHSYQADATLTHEAEDLFFTKLNQTTFFSDPAAFAVYTLQPIGSSMLRPGAGKHPMNINLTAAPYIWVSVSFQYLDASLDDVVLDFSTEITQDIENLAKTMKKSNPYIYLNDAGSNQDPLASYGVQSYDRLQNIRQKYDPRKVFTTLCSGGYKLKV